MRLLTSFRLLHGDGGVPTLQLPSGLVGGRLYLAVGLGVEREGGSIGKKLNVNGGGGILGEGRCDCQARGVRLYENRILLSA